MISITCWVQYQIVTQQIIGYIMGNQHMSNSKTTNYQFIAEVQDYETISQLSFSGNPKICFSLYLIWSLHYRLGLVIHYHCFIQGLQPIIALATLLILMTYTPNLLLLLLQYIVNQILIHKHQSIRSVILLYSHSTLNVRIGIHLYHHISHSTPLHRKAIVTFLTWRRQHHSLVSHFFRSLIFLYVQLL